MSGYYYFSTTRFIKLSRIIISPVDGMNKGDCIPLIQFLKMPRHITSPASRFEEQIVGVRNVRVENARVRDNV